MSRRADRGAWRRDPGRAVGAAQPAHGPGPRRWAVIWLGLIGAVAARRAGRACARRPAIARARAPARRDVAAERAAADGRACALRLGEGDDRGGRLRGARAGHRPHPAVAARARGARGGRGRGCTSSTWRSAPSWCGDRCWPEPCAGVALLRRRQRARDRACRDRPARPRRRARDGAASRTRVWGFAVGGVALAFVLALGPAGRRRGRGPDVVAGATVAALVAAGQIAWRVRMRDPAGRARRRAGGARAARPRDRRRRALQPLGARSRRAGRDRGHRGAAGAAQLSLAGPRRDPVPGRVCPGRGWRSASATGAALLAPPRAPRGTGGRLRPAGAVLVGALTNDSGPIILLIGSSYLLFAAVYLAAVPPCRRTDRCDAGVPLPCRRPPLIASRRMRIALVSPYSWSFPGGVTRHIDALAREFIASGHHVRVLAPVDPDDRLTRAAASACAGTCATARLRRAAGAHGRASHERRDVPPVAEARGGAAAAAELRGGDFDVIHVHEPIAPRWGGTRAPSSRCARRGHVPRLLVRVAAEHDCARDRGAARVQPVHARIAVSEAARWTGERFFGGTLPRDPEWRRPRGRAGRPEAGQRCAADRVRGPRGGAQGPAGAAVGFAGLRQHVPGAPGA